MLKMRAIVYLDTGARRDHEVEAKDDAEYVDWMNNCIKSLGGNPLGVLIFTTPFCMYKVQNIIAIEFVDPPKLSEKLGIGFKHPS